MAKKGARANDTRAKNAIKREQLAHNPEIKQRFDAKQVGFFSVSSPLLSLRTTLCRRLPSASSLTSWILLILLGPYHRPCDIRYLILCRFQDVLAAILAGPKADIKDPLQGQDLSKYKRKEKVCKRIPRGRGGEATIHTCHPSISLAHHCSCCFLAGGQRRSRFGRHGRRRG